MTRRGYCCSTANTRNCATFAAASCFILFGTVIPLLLSEHLEEATNARVEPLLGVLDWPPSYRLPPLHELVQQNESKIIGDVQPLLDFVIPGFAKSGTSTMMVWLNQHPQVAAIQHELYDLEAGDSAQLVEKLYKAYHGPGILHGYKSPAEIQSLQALQSYQRYFPRTKILIGVRHPVWWFESLYNFRIQNSATDPRTWLPHPNKLIGKCNGGQVNTCTIYGDVAFALMSLGKTETTQLERDIWNHYFPGAMKDKVEKVPIPNPVFLFEVSQLNNSTDFARSVQRFLGLTTPFPPMVHVTPGKHHDATVQAQKDALKIHICHDEFAPVRRELVWMAQMSAKWLMEQFLHSADVHVANRPELVQKLETWTTDPCARRE